MMQVLSEEETIKFQENRLKNTIEWFSSLSIREKIFLYDRYKDLFNQIKCKHTNIKKINYYSSSRYFCDNCSISFSEEEIRNNKIDEILKGDN